MRIAFGAQVLGDLDLAAAREWLIPDGLGGYAMGTISGLRTRRYHALLMVPDPNAATRKAALIALDPVLGDTRLAVHEWADGTIAPQGHRFLEEFTLVDGLPRWRWRVGTTVLSREIAMLRGRSCVAVVHRLLAGGPVDLTLEAICAWRDQHGEQGPSFEEGHYRLRGPQWTPDGTWLRGVHARAEKERGYQANEDLVLAGRFHQRLEKAGDALEVTAWANGEEPPPASTIIDLAATRRLSTLHRAADAFVVKGPDVVAGYPWFGAWSRDTMTSYEGLFLVTGRADEGRELLRNYAATLSEGMLANTADGGTVGYNTADATLWFIHAIDRHVTLTGDTDLMHELRPALDGVLKAHLHGTRYGIRADEDGLLRQGAPGEALTWMDARVNGEPVTPRRGKAVEINALWCNALAVLGSPLHDRAVASFRRLFTFPKDTADSNLMRPNQLLAYSLPHAPLEPDAVALRKIGDALMTPLGLRSLAPFEDGYRPRHTGSLVDRDLAYHQGTVWPWLIGPYATALHKAGLPTDDLLAGLMSHLGDYGLGSISETCDGDAPHHATGCPFQAWSVAELARVAVL